MCLPRCGLCCSYRVLVTGADRRRLSALSPPSACSDPWEASSDGELALRRRSPERSAERSRRKPTPDIPGFCVFLDERQRCTVYGHRPERCRAYPYLWTTYDRLELDVDLSCPGLGRPGLGRGEVIATEWRDSPDESTAQRARREAAIRGVRDLLYVQQRYADPEALGALGAHCVNDLAAGWTAARPAGVSTLHVAQIRPLSTNVDLETEDVLPAVWESLLLAHRSVESLSADNSYVERHFARPRWNTRLSSAGEVTLYCFWVDDGTFLVRERGGVSRAIALDDIAQLAWEPEALATRRAYLERWLRRQLPVRLANNLALASPPPGGHVAAIYLAFLVEIDWRLVVLAPALARVNGKEAVDREVALEAVRGSDGLLRAWCESARLGIAD